MSSEKTLFDGGVIEVPPELRGPSNEEILQREGREDTEKRRRSAARPSKRERQRMKLEKERAAMLKNAVGNAETPAPKAAPAPVQATEEKKVAPKPSFARKKLEMLFSAGRRVIDRHRESVTPPPAEPVVKKHVLPAAPAVPASGRVLRGSFGSKPSEAAKAEVYSVADLQRIRMEERAKKIRDALAAKNRAEIPLGPDGQPVKRPRGRPRKNPLPPAENP